MRGGQGSWGCQSSRDEPLLAPHPQMQTQKHGEASTPNPRGNWEAGKPGQALPRMGAAGKAGQV